MSEETYVIVLQAVRETLQKPCFQRGTTMGTRLLEAQHMVDRILATLVRQSGSEDWNSCKTESMEQALLRTMERIIVLLKPLEAQAKSTCQPLEEIITRLLLQSLLPRQQAA